MVFSFEPLNKTHFQLLHDWFNNPHVQEFYSLKSWTLDEVQKKLEPHSRGEKGIKGFVVTHLNKPIGYIQICPIKDHPWEDQDLPQEISDNGAGIDLFIGEPSCIGKGLGSAMVNQFLDEYIWPSYRYCLADPDVRNRASLRLFEKCGFKKHKEIAFKDALGRDVTLLLVIHSSVSEKSSSCH